MDNLSLPGGSNWQPDFAEYKRGKQIDSLDRKLMPLMSTMLNKE